MRGGKRADPHLNLVRGNPGRRRREAAESAPEIVSAPFPAPEYLTEVARDEWLRVEPRYRELGMRSEDLPHLEALCSEYATFRQALDEERAKAGKSLKVKSQAIGWRRKAEIAYAKLAEQLRMRIAARTKGIPVAKTDDPLAKYLKKV